MIYGLQHMKIKTPLFRKIRQFHKKDLCRTLKNPKSMLIYPFDAWCSFCTNYYLCAAISRKYYWSVIDWIESLKPRLLWQWPSAHLMFHLLTITNSESMGVKVRWVNWPMMHSNTMMVSKEGSYLVVLTLWAGNQVLLEQANQHHHKGCQQTGARNTNISR